MNIHVHIYDQQPALVFDDNLIEEIDLEEIDQYDDYIQYGFERNGEWIEIRIPK